MSYFFESRCVCGCLDQQSKTKFTLTSSATSEKKYQFSTDPLPGGSQTPGVKNAPLPTPAHWTVQWQGSTGQTREAPQLTASISRQESELLLTMYLSVQRTAVPGTSDCTCVRLPMQALLEAFVHTTVRE